jgi:plasmid maintenance system antidote protein VapI
MARRNARTITEQAELCDMARPHLSDILAGRKAVSLATALKIARGTGGTVEDLFGPAA